MEISDEEWGRFLEKFDNLVDDVGQIKTDQVVLRTIHEQRVAPAVRQVWVTKQDVDQAKGALRLAKWLIGALGTVDAGLVIHAIVQTAGS